MQIWFKGTRSLDTRCCRVAKWAAELLLKERVCCDSQLLLQTLAFVSSSFVFPLAADGDTSPLLSDTTGSPDFDMRRLSRLQPHGSRTDSMPP